MSVVLFPLVTHAVPGQPDDPESTYAENDRTRYWIS